MLNPKTPLEARTARWKSVTCRLANGYMVKVSNIRDPQFNFSKLTASSININKSIFHSFKNLYQFMSSQVAWNTMKTKFVYSKYL